MGLSWQPKRSPWCELLTRSICFSGLTRASKEMSGSGFNMGLVCNSVILSTDELFKFALLLSTACQSILTTHVLAAIVAMMHNVLYFLQVHCEVDIAICDLATSAESWYTHVKQALCSIEFRTHVYFTCIGSSFSNPHKNFFILRPSRHAPSSPAKAGISTRAGSTVPRRTLAFDVYCD